MPDSGQPVPETPGQVIRCIYESLALRYSEVWERLVTYVDKAPLHIVGGGCQDRLLNQFATNAIGISVSDSPVEATGLANIIIQMLAAGVIDSIKQGREIVAYSSIVGTFEPEDQEAWQAAKAQ